MERDPLTSAEKKQLRGMAQTLKPAVFVGRHGVSGPVLEEIEAAFRKNALIKIRFDASRAAMEQLVGEICDATGSECVGTLGRTAAFYHHSPRQDP